MNRRDYFDNRYVITNKGKEKLSQVKIGTFTSTKWYILQDLYNTPEGLTRHEIVILYEESLPQPALNGLMEEGYIRYAPR